MHYLLLALRMQKSSFANVSSEDPAFVPACGGSTLGNMIRDYNSDTKSRVNMKPAAI